jgi:hypothetical protein
MKRCEQFRGNPCFHICISRPSSIKALGFPPVSYLNYEERREHIVKSDKCRILNKVPEKGIILN